MFITKSFSPGDAQRGQIDFWLNSLGNKETGMMIVGYTEFDGFLFVTVKRWKRSDQLHAQTAAARTTIDEIPEEPSINYGSETTE